MRLRTGEICPPRQAEHPRTGAVRQRPGPSHLSFFRVKRAQISKIPFCDDEFGLVVVCDVLEHIAEDDQVVAEMAG